MHMHLKLARSSMHAFSRCPKRDQKQYVATSAEVTQQRDSRRKIVLPLLKLQ